MTQTAHPSLRELRRETEETRAGLTRTVDQLRNSVTETAGDLRQRIRPEAIKAEVSDYVRSRGERLMQDITSAARRNPMQAVAVGASVAYPLLRLARAIPLPVLMVGAGLFFAGSKAGQSVTQKASDLASDLSDEVRRRSHDLSDQVGASITGAKDMVADAVGNANEAIAAGVDQFRQSTGAANREFDTGAESLGVRTQTAQDELVSRTRDLKDGVAGVVAAATDGAQNLATGASAAVRSAAASTRDSALDAARGLRDQAADISDRAGKTFLETVEQNPLLVAGVGLLIGGLIASALPRSDIEDGLVGDASSSAKRRAQEAASQGFEAAKGVAGEILGNVVRQAGAEGLTPDGLDEAARDIGQRLRRVAETAVTTALDPGNAPKTTADAGEHHG
ncbi:MAG TPA: hypothetical protein VIL63_08025 [Terriglobales bacterium]